MRDADVPSDDAFPFSQNTECFLPRFLSFFDFDVSDADDAVAKQTWYERSQRYWAAQPPTARGMILGPGASAGDDTAAKAVAADLAGTTNFLRAHSCGGGRALDCGAGIGRVSFGALAGMFRTVDMLEPSETFVRTVKNAGGAPGGGMIFNATLQGVTVGEVGHRQGSSVIPASIYDLVLVNWCAAFLTDDDLIVFLCKAQQMLKPRCGRVVFKENIAPMYFRARRRSASVARTDAHFLALFGAAGLSVQHERMQTGLPEGWLDVKMYLLAPRGDLEAEDSRKP